MFKDELLRLWHTYFNAAGIATNYGEYQGYIVLKEFGAACIVVPDNWAVRDEDIIQAAKVTAKSKIFVLKGLPQARTYPEYAIHFKGDPVGCDVAPENETCRSDNDCCCVEWSWVLARCRGEYGRMWGDFGEGPEEYSDLTNYPKDTGRCVANGLAAVGDTLRHQIADRENELDKLRRYVADVDDNVETYRRWDAAPYPK